MPRDSWLRGWAVRALRVPAALEHAALARAEREHVPRLGEVLRAVGAVAHGLGGVKTLTYTKKCAWVCVRPCGFPLLAIGNRTLLRVER